MASLRDNARALTPGTPLALLKAALPPAVVIFFALFMQFGVHAGLGQEYAFASKLLLDGGIAIILAVSLTIVNGFTGQFSMGHAAFMAVGAYTAAGVMYYSSARTIGDETFADPNRHGGLVSTMLNDRTDTIDASTLEWTPGEASFKVLMPDYVPKGRSGTLTITPEEGEAFRAVFTLPDSLTEGQAVPLSAAPPATLAPDATAEFRLRQRVVTRSDGMFLIALLAGGMVAAACGYMVGLPSLRLRGDYLAIVTLGFGEIMRVIIQSQTKDVIYSAQEIAATPWWHLPRALGGSLGFSGLPSYSSLFWVYLFVGVTMLVAFRLKRSTFGRALLSIREDEIAAEAMGVNTTRYKVRAFVVSSFLAGVAGGLFAHSVGVQLNAGELGFVKSFDIIIMVVLGGLGSISGAALAAVILTVLPEALRQFEQYRMVTFAVALVLMMILRPQGLFGVREIWDPHLWRWLGAGKKRAAAAPAPQPPKGGAA